MTLEIILRCYKSNAYARKSMTLTNGREPEGDAGPRDS